MEFQMMDFVSYENHDSVGVIRLGHGVTNAIDLALVAELDDLLLQVSLDSRVHSLVLTGSNDKFFSIGFAIPSLYDLSERDFKVFYQAFNRFCITLYSFPKPTLAAMPGHAIAGGCILALCCDFRLIASGHRLMGLNEIKLGVPVPYPADRILREIVGVRQASWIMETGDFFSPEKALLLGLVDQIVPIDELETVAFEKVRNIGSLSPPAFALIKHNRVGPVIDHLEQAMEPKEEAFIERWYSPEARQHLKDAMKKF